jgi:copper chaperone
MLKLRIKGMTCSHCVSSVTRALAAVPGVLRVEDVSLARGEAVLEGAPETSALLRAVRGEGYDVEAVAS